MSKRIDFDAHLSFLIKEANFMVNNPIHLYGKVLT